MLEGKGDFFFNRVQRIFQRKVQDKANSEICVHYGTHKKCTTIAVEVKKVEETSLRATRPTLA